MKKSLIAIIAICSSSAVLAAPTFYVGGGVGVSDYKFTDVLAPSQSASDDIAYNLRGGVEWDVAEKLKLGAEVNYHSVQTTISGLGTDIDVGNYGFGVAGVARYNVVGNWDAVVKFGVVRDIGTVTANGVPDFKDYNNHFQTTVGGAYRLNKSVAITADYSRYHTDPNIRAGAYQVGVEYRF